MPEFTGQRDLRAYLRILWRWKLLVVAILIAAPAVAYLMERGKPRIYQSSVLVNVPQVSVGSAGSSFTTNNINTIAALVNTTPVANIAGNLLKPPVPGSTIVGDVSASPNVTTGLLTITATTTNPVFAANVANAFAKALGISQHNQLVAQTNSQIAALRAQAHQLPRHSASRQQVEQQILQARTQLNAVSSGAQILQAATPNPVPTGPHTRRAIELGFVIGLLVAFAAVMLLEGANRRMRTPDDLEALTGLPLLAAIAPSAFSAKLETTPADAESFQMLRTALTYFTVDRELRSVMFTSPGEKEGKSTVACRLALAAARAGLDVILVDADLRRGGASECFGLSASPGLGIVLAQSRPPESALVDAQISGEGVGRLRVLPAGPPPPNPAALISSSAMRSLLSALEAQSELVVIDSPAALAVSDAVPLMGAVSGIVLIARMSQTSRETIRRLRKIVEAAHGRLLGTVATAVTSAPGYEKYSQEYYATAADRKTRRRDKKVGAQPQQSGVQLGAARSASVSQAATQALAYGDPQTARAVTDPDPGAAR